METKLDELDEGRVAIIAAAGRFPEARSPAQLWDLIMAGRDAIHDYGEAELRRAGVDPRELDDPDYVRRGWYFAEAELFDAAAFGYAPREAIRIDPQQRVFLELCHEALERAGYGPGTFAGDIGVYAGARPSSWIDRIAHLPREQVGDRLATLGGNTSDSLATRVAYKLDCTGPALTVQTYCSTSLVATHLASQQLLDGECDMALAGGVALRFPQGHGYRWQHGGTLSRRGRCLAFDERGDGIIFTDAAAVVVLRRLEDALRDRDPILAVIRGSAMTNDGASRLGYAAPNVAGQARAIHAAIRTAAVDPRDIGLVEAHGAGTAIGDATEFAALVRAFQTKDRGYCGLGSIKTQIGHCDCAAGVTALIKAAWAVREGVLPPSIGFARPHPEIDLLDSPFYMVREPEPWSADSRIAGVSSLGIGGTNVHVIVEQPPVSATAPSRVATHVLPISARSEAALARATEELERWLLSNPDVELADVAFTLQRGRKAEAHRRVIVAVDAIEAAERLAGPQELAGLDARARAWLDGRASEWTDYRDEARRRIELPTRPFERERFAPEPPADPPTAAVIAATPTPAPEPQPMPAAAPVSSSSDRVLTELRELIAGVLELAVADVDPERPLLELGADSLLLLAILEPIERRFGVALSMRQFFAELPTVGRIAAYLAEQAPAERAPAPRPVQPPELAPMPKPAIPPPAEAGVIERVVAEQLRIMQQQLELLGARPSASSVPELPEPAERAPTKAPTKMPIPGQVERPAPIESEDRQRFLDRFVPAYTARTRRSKAAAAALRPRVADSRSAIGFRPSIKELVYPIVGDLGEGARLVDIDGNRYVDMTMGFGVHMLGHRPPRITEALAEHQRRGFALGLRGSGVVEVAESILELTGMDRLAFVNTGTEAVMTALRVARAATRKDGVVLFSTSYHGHSDSVMAAPAIRDGQPSSRPLALGVPFGAIADVTVLELGTEAALDYIRAHGSGLAAVMVEPVPTRRPGLQDPEYLRRLRAVTREAGVLLIFDEIVTGFRCHPGGVQGLFGIEADIATYGKALGGGMPLAVVAGRPGLLDAIDGGVWHYGDGSYPGHESTFFGGTFFQHPLALTGARAFLAELRERGPALQEGLNHRTAAFTARLDAYFEAEGLAIEAQAFGSFFRLVHRDNLDLLYYLLLAKGVYIWEWRCWFLSTAHGEAELELVFEALRESVAELRAAKLMPGETRATTIPVVAPEPAPARVATCLAQRQLWALELADGDSSLAYNVFGGVELRGAVDRAALRAAIDQLVERHEAIRARPIDDGEALSVATPAEARALLALETRRCQSEAELDATLRDVAARRFALDELRVRVVLIDAPGRLLVVLVGHHLVMDGWSITLLLEDLAALYSAAIDGREPPPAPAGLAPLAAWIAAAPTRPGWARARARWRALARSLDQPLELPGARRIGLGSAASRRHRIEFDADELARIQGAAARLAVTPFMLCAAAYTLLLHRISGCERLCVAAPVVRRPPGERPTVGYATELLGLASSLRSGQSVREYLAAIRDEVLAAFETEGYDYGHALADQLVSGQDVRAAFTLDRAPKLPRFAALEVRALAAMPVGHAPFAIDVNGLELGDALRFDFDVQLDAIAPALAEALPRYFATLVRALIEAEPEAEVATLAMLEPSERERILAWGRGPVRAAGPESVIARFLAQARRTPDRIALRCAGRSLRYAEVEARAAAVAAGLHGRGIGGRDRVVAVRLARSERLPIAVLGVWRTGAAYVPLDLKYPAERQRKIVDDAEPVAILGEGPCPEFLDPARWLDLDALLEAGAGQPAPDPIVAPEDLAYLMYSSGSTGAPKGIAIEAGGLLNHVLAKIEDYGVDQGSVVAQNAPAGFDIVVWQMVAALLVGGCVAIYPDAIVLDPAELLAGLERDGVTVLELVPSYLALVLDELDARENSPGLEALRCVILQAEPLAPALVERLRRRLPEVEISNAYGATETSDDVLHLILDEPPTTAITPTGAPIRNARIYVLDRWSNPCPPLVPGELCVGGIAVGRGYVRPELSRPDAFSQRDPICPDEPGRFYRTGDRVAYRLDGRVEILGRGDNQVKVRGQRVELGEIERAVQALPEVSHAVVAAWPDPHETNLICAYVVPARPPLDVPALERALARLLPDYMVPRRFMVLDALPLNANDKVDRSALPRPTNHEVEPTPALSKPSSHARELLALAAEHLPITPVLERGFFAQGGTSIAAVRLVQGVRREFGVSLPVSRIYELDTLAAIAAAIEEASAAETAAIPRAPAAASYPASASARRMHFLWSLEPETAAYNIPMVYEFDGEVELARLEAALAAVVEAHAIFRSAFVVEGDAVVQKIIAGARPRLERLAASDAAVEDLLAGWVRPHDLERPPLLRAAWAPRATGGLLLLDLHHIVFDEGSANLLLRDLAAAYRDPDALRRTAARRLGYHDFAAWEQEFRRSPAYRRHLEFWLDRLRDGPPALDLSTTPRPAIASFVGAREVLELGPELTAAVRRYAAEHDASLYMVLLAGFAVVLGRYAGRRELVIGTPVDGRHHPDAAEIVGMFGNSLPLRLSLDDRAGFDALVIQIRRVTLETLEHQAVPLEDIVAALGLRRDPSRNPLFDHMFVFTNLDRYALDIDGLAVRPVHVTLAVARMDLTLSAYERRDEIELGFEYATALFDPPAIRRMARDLRTLLSAALRAPTRPLAELPEVRFGVEAVPEAWERGPTRAITGSIPAEFWARCRERGQALALCRGDQRWTYASLGEWVRAIAARLEDAGIGRGAIVGVGGEDPAVRVAAMLAIVSVGALYLPLSASAGAVELARAQAVIAAPAAVGPTIIDGAPDPELAARFELDDARLGLGPSEAAYVLHSSGSTGAAKAIVGEHGGLLRLVRSPRWLAPSGPGQGDLVVLQGAGELFDAWLANLGLALLNGGTLVLPGPDELLEPERVAALIAAHGITHAIVPTSLFHAWMLAAPGSIDGLATLLVGGERLRPELARAAIERRPARALWNVYGPSEAGIIATVHRVTLTDEPGAELPIGRPIDETRVYVLDERGARVGVGEVGEIAIAGLAVARGYLDDEGPGSQRFVGDPSTPGERMYMTGDLGRWRADGALEFVGRIDEQLKIAGHRVNPLDVEAIVNATAGVREAAVVAGAGDLATAGLAAHVVLEPGASAVAVRERLDARLDGPTRPRRWWFVDALPRTATGKIDRAALRERAPTPSQTGGPGTQARLATIWAAVLERSEPIDPDADFFALGGHSLLAIILRAKIREAFAVDVPLRTLLASPTLRSVATFIDDQAATPGAHDSELSEVLL